MRFLKRWSVYRYHVGTRDPVGYIVTSHATRWTANRARRRTGPSGGEMAAGHRDSSYFYEVHRGVALEIKPPRHA